jgi:hypothetical protein
MYELYDSGLKIERLSKNEILVQTVDDQEFIFSQQELYEIYSLVFGKRDNEDTK